MRGEYWNIQGDAVEGIGSDVSSLSLRPNKSVASFRRTRFRKNLGLC